MDESGEHHSQQTDTRTENERSILETTDAGEDVEKKEHFYTVGGSVN